MNVYFTKIHVDFIRIKFPCNKTLYTQCLQSMQETRHLSFDMIPIRGNFNLTLP